MDDEISTLILQLADPQYSARKVAAKKLERHGIAAASALREALDSPNPVVAIYAARLLGTLGDQESVPHLTRRLYSTDTEVVLAVGDALDLLARKQASAEAIARIRAAQVDARRWRDAPLTTAEYQERTWRPPAPLETMGSTQPASVEQIRRRAIAGLPGHVEGLVATLGHRDFAHRAAAVEALVERGEAVVEATCQALSHRSPVTCQRAAEALGRIGSQDALLPLLERLRQEINAPFPDENVSLAIRDALGRIVRRAPDRPFTLTEALALIRLHPASSHVLPPGLPAMGAQRLQELAETHPTPELRSALPHLKGMRPFIPREFVEARSAIEEATKAWKDLPIAAIEAQDEENLPRPAESHVDERNLPRPSGEAPE